MRVAPDIVLTDEEKAGLERLIRSKLTSVRLVQRARIVLLAAEGKQNKDIAEALAIGRVQVSAGAHVTARSDWQVSSAICHVARRRPEWLWHGCWN